MIPAEQCSFILRASLNIVITAFLVFLFSGCNSEQQTTTNQFQPESVDSTITPNSFLSFDNPQASLVTGEYYLVAATNQVGVSDTYNLLVEYDDGTTENFSGSWSNSSGPGLENPQHSINVIGASGVKAKLTSSADNLLYLIRNDHIISQDDNSAGGTNALINLPAQKINNQEYADAYYLAVDPESSRTTLSDWKAINGFNESNFKRVTFRDSKDLGYGRDMYFRYRDDGGIAIFVNNYLVQTQAGDASTYGAINVEAAVVQDKNFHVGTNAIEFSPIDETDPESDKIVKIFTFQPADDNGVQTRLTAGNLDGRGVKYMPTMCLACHGGNLYPLNIDGSFPEDSLRSAKLNFLDPTTFDFSSVDGFTLDDQQAGIKLINAIVLESYEQIKQQTSGRQGEWNADFPIELVKGHYGEDFSAQNFDNTFVPQGWRQDGFRPDGVELLYREVVGPHCIGCHSLRGNDAGEVLVAPVNLRQHDVQVANSINFSSFEKFIEYSDLIIEKVFRRGRMPMSLINYTQFWENPDAAPSLLASFLPGFDVFDSNGKIVAPYVPIAVPGSDRVATSPLQLDGLGSVLSESFFWEIISKPEGATASISDQYSATPTFNADLNGTYTLQLTTRNSLAESLAKQFSVTINNNLSPTPAELTFANDIRAVLSRENIGIACVECHSADGDFPSIPVYYTDNNPNLYRDVLERIDFNEPENSVFIRKPTRLQHGGGVRIDRSTINGEADYQTIINWIKNGAPCGDDPLYCE